MRRAFFMPQRPNKPCRLRGCGVLTRNASGYCDAHASQATGWTRSRKGSASARGYGHAWRQLRAEILRRDDGLCQPCLRAGAVTLAAEVDHIVGKAEAKRLGWTREQIDAHENLQAICGPCHAAKTARESRKGSGSPRS